jgi:predicted metalloendopeptidase
MLLFALALASHIDVAGMDAKVAPGDDFDAYANGAWAKSTPIPADRSSWGLDAMLAEEARKKTVDLIQHGDDPKVAAYYAAFMDEDAIEKLGASPLKDELDAIAAIKDKRDLARALGAQLRADTDPLNATDFSTPHLFGLWVAQALDDPSRNVPYLMQGGLGMPDREYYVSDKPEMVKLREAYKAHVIALMRIAGDKWPEVVSDRVISIETQVARVHASRVDSEDVHQPVAVDFASLPPGMDWAAFFEGAGFTPKRVCLWQPKAIAALAKLVDSEPLAEWKDWMKFHAIDEMSPFLSKAFVDEGFAFYGKSLEGTPELEQRWKRGVDYTSGALGFAIGRMYAAKYFSPEAKAKCAAMVSDLVRAFGARIDRLSWMSPSTKAKAKEKLATLKVGVGYPDRWRDYSALDVKKGDAYGNAKRASLFEYRRNVTKLASPVDRGEWAMVPQLVDAVNLPLLNALNFPAAIIQVPYFDVNADAALNYGAMGAVIGHEISHSFDDTGSEFDANGKLSRWWTDDDLAHFRAAGDKLAAEFDKYEPLPGLHVNGKQTLGENIADVAGLAVAYDAWKLSLNGQKPHDVDGMSGEKAFFVAFAQAWRTELREEVLRDLVVSNEHAPPAYRADTVRNVDAWVDAFGVKAGQKLYLAPADRVRVW